MIESALKIHFLDIDCFLASRKIFPYGSFFVGAILAIVFNNEYHTHRISEQVIRSLHIIAADPPVLFKTVILQLSGEFIFVLFALLASYTVVPKIFLCVISTIKGYHNLTAIRVTLSSSLAASIFDKAVVSLFLISISVIFIRYISSLIYSVEGYNHYAEKSELSLLFSSQSINRLRVTFTACGSTILLNLLKTMLHAQFSF